MILQLLPEDSNLLNVQRVIYTPRSPGIDSMLTDWLGCFTDGQFLKIHTSQTRLFQESTGLPRVSSFAPQRHAQTQRRRRWPAQLGRRWSHPEV